MNKLIFYDIFINHSIKFIILISLVSIKYEKSVISQLLDLLLELLQSTPTLVLKLQCLLDYIIERILISLNIFIPWSLRFKIEIKFWNTLITFTNFNFVKTCINRVIQNMISFSFICFVFGKWFASVTNRDLINVLQFLFKIISLLHNSFTLTFKDFSIISQLFDICRQSLNEPCCLND